MSGQVVGARVQGPGRRKFRRQTGDDEIVKMLKMQDVLQPVLAQVAQRDPHRERVLHQAAGCSRNDDLSAMGCVGDASGSMHVHAHVMGTADDPLTGVEAHADPHPRALGPIVGLKVALGHHGGVDCALRTCEGGEKRVAGGVHLRAVTRRNGAADDAGMFAANLRVGIAQSVHQSSRALDVGEEERDGAARQVRHL